MTPSTEALRPEYMTNELNFVVLADEALSMRNFAAFRTTVRIALLCSFDAPIEYEERDGWRFGNITVHRTGDERYRLSSVNGYRLGGFWDAYPKLLDALRAAWVISHFTGGVLTDQGKLITNPDLTLPAFKMMRAAIYYCREFFMLGEFRS